MSLRPITTARAPAMAIVRPLEQLDHARRRAGDERRPVLDEQPDVDRMESVDVLVRPHDIEHPPFGVRSHRLGQGRLHQDPVVHLAAIQAIDHGQQIVQRGVGGQPFGIRPQPGLGGRLQLAADIDVGCRIVADQHDAQAGRPADPGGKRRDHRHQLTPNLIRDGDAVEDASTHVLEASTSSLFERIRPGRGRPACRRRESCCRAAD